LNCNQTNLNGCASECCKEPNSEHVFSAGTRVKNGYNKKKCGSHNADRGNRDWANA
jgi:hypothetical protein